ncbi:DUF3046 domain-containing protein [Galactobacter caseinivorans]|uniref:DUF3046 domain-containing protein n=1 Tax=Galactobacter caseinivorans TaxID=2676123 RepID=A0A496PJZ5_9MICC|nr:DUF3046 domain-containing protein [Galactobacter caseinivorans]RKW70801.1 DUF3046 domain-containing protein [Galactobacter caseinivorans]
MRVSEFWRLMDGEFGAAGGHHLATSLNLSSLGSRTAEAALAVGYDPREVWEALCLMQDVPRERWLGEVIPLRQERWDG